MDHRDIFERDGFVILPEWIPSADLESARVELGNIYPSAAEFHSDPHSSANSSFLADEFAGIRTFPYPSVLLCLLTIHPQLVGLAKELLGTTDVRLYTAELWAKYTGAANYDQPFHRDFLNHSILVPRPEAHQDQVEMFLFLDDVPQSLGPPHFVSKQITGYQPPLPNWFGRNQRPDWYENEVSAAGMAGTVVAFGIDTFHRASELVLQEGARYTIQVGFRKESTEWASRIAWATHSHEDAWYEFVNAATIDQLQLFGFPPAGHEYWTPETIEYVSQRYPGLDVSPLIR